MADVFDYNDSMDYEKRDQFRSQMPHRLVFRLCYDKTGSIRVKQHLYSLIPFLEINNGENTLTRLKPGHKRFYEDSYSDFERNFSFSDFQNAQFTPDQLQNIYPWREKYNQMYRMFRPGFPDDITMEEETMYMDFAVEISPDDVCSLLGKTWKERETKQTADQKKIEALEGQVAELAGLLKQLLDNK